MRASPRVVPRALSVAFVVASIALILLATLRPGPPDVGRTAGGMPCIACGETPAADAVMNIVLFMPFGAALAGLGARARRVAGAVAIGAALLSLAIECMQYAGLPPGRVASLLDLATNTIGAFVGAIVVTHWRALVHPSPRRATRLALGWAGCACTVFVATGWLLSFPPPAVTPSLAGRGEWRISDLPHAPRWGWYAPNTDSVVVNDHPFEHRGNGPVIVESPDVSRYRVRASVRGRDSRAALVSIVWLHRRTETSAMLLLGQRGTDAVVQSDRRAQRLGLLPIEAVVRDAFVSGSAAASTIAGGDTVQRTLLATVSNRAMTVRAVNQQTSLPMKELAMVPSMGWALVQPFVGAERSGAWICRLLWFIVLVTPVAYWGWQTHARRATICLGSIAAIAIMLALVPRWFDIAPESTGGWMSLALAFSAGLAIGHAKSTTDPRSRRWMRTAR